MQQPACVAYLRLRRGLQVTQAVAQPLSRQAELAILLVDTGHTLEYHFIILSGQSTDMRERVHIYSPMHVEPFRCRKAKIGCSDTDVFVQIKC